MKWKAANLILALTLLVLSSVYAAAPEGTYRGKLQVPPPVPDDYVITITIQGRQVSGEVHGSLFSEVVGQRSGTAPFSGPVKGTFDPATGKIEGTWSLMGQLPTVTLKDGSSVTFKDGGYVGRLSAVLQGSKLTGQLFAEQWTTRQGGEGTPVNMKFGDFAVSAAPAAPAAAPASASGGENESLAVKIAKLMGFLAALSAACYGGYWGVKKFLSPKKVLNTKELEELAATSPPSTGDVFILPVPEAAHNQIVANISGALPDSGAAQLTKGEWLKMPDARRQQIVKYFVNATCKQLNLPQNVQIDFVTDPNYPYSGEMLCNENPPRMIIRTSGTAWDSPAWTIDSAAHEIRHLQQYTPTVPMESQQIRDIATANAQSPYDIAKDPLGYIRQFNERDARSLGAKLAKEMAKRAYALKLEKLHQLLLDNAAGAPKQV